MNLEVANNPNLKKNVYLLLSLILLAGFLLRIYLSYNIRGRFWYLAILG
jgi:hypothetical protein